MMRYTLLPGCASIIPGFAPVWTDTIPLLLKFPLVAEYIPSESALVRFFKEYTCFQAEW